MAGMGPAPKPDSSRRRTNAATFDWVILPASRTDPAPELPAWRLWHDRTKEWWADLWSKSQAVMWDQTGESLWTLACLYDDLISNRAEASKVSAEMRQHEDRHGLNPKAMLQLRWRLAPEPEKKPRQRRRTQLKVVD